MDARHWSAKKLCDLTVAELDELLAVLSARLPADDPLLAAARRQLRRREGLPEDS